MPVLVAGNNGDENQRDLTIFALISLIDRRDACKLQLNVLSLSILCTVMASWTIKASLVATCVLLVLSISFCMYALYRESQTLRTIQTELLVLLRDTSREDIEQFFGNSLQVPDMHED